MSSQLPVRSLDILAVIVEVGSTMENTPVLQAQVGEQLVALSRMGYEAGLITFVRDRQAFERAIGHKLRAAGVAIILLPDRGLAQNLWEMSRMLRKLVDKTGVNRAYVRGFWGALPIALSGLRRLPYVFDVRGSNFDEALARGNGRIKRAVYFWLENHGISRATRVAAVSHPLAQVVKQRFGVDEVEVIPCCVNFEDRDVGQAEAAARRVQMGFSPEDCVLVYSGGLSFYQQIPATLEIWRKLLDMPEVRFLLMTSDDPQKAKPLVGDLSDFGSRLVHLSLPSREVPAALAAADIGFLLRDARELNRVASPVKFPEYLSAGLSVVGSPGTGDVSDLIKEWNVGCLVDPADVREGTERVRSLIHRRRSDPEAWRERARELARVRFDWFAYGEAFARLYGPAAVLQEQ
jgi:glycosyltransferase involved in cell wall biosynthesis